MDNEYLIFGVYPIIEAIKSQVTIHKLYVQKGTSNTKINDIVQQLENTDVSISFVPQEKLDKLTRSNHQGIVALSSPISFISIEELVENAFAKNKKPLFLILEQISDVRNFGAIIRTAECTDVDGIIIQKKGGAPISGDTVKTSAGKGISRSVLNLVNEKAALPLLGEINSLNVSVACGAFLYEVVRQRAS